MFKHQGKSRTNKHNFQIAAILSFIAGIVNVAGFLSIQRLTTNVTGHFAIFIYDVSNFQIWQGTVYLFYILSFLFGSFTSSVFIELISKYQKMNKYVIPALLESATLIGVAILYDFSILTSTDIIACLLLFAMGLQNSFVTNISHTSVRTTHLTGLFTDLGIELAQILFIKNPHAKKKIVSTIKLRLSIIYFFFLGGVAGGILYALAKMNSLIIAALILIAGLIIDDIKFRMLLYKRKKRMKRIGTIATVNGY